MPASSQPTLLIVYNGDIETLLTAEEINSNGDITLLIKHLDAAILAGVLSPTSDA